VKNYNTVAVSVNKMVWGFKITVLSTETEYLMKQNHGQKHQDKSEKIMYTAMEVGNVQVDSV